MNRRHFIQTLGTAMAGAGASAAAGAAALQDQGKVIVAQSGEALGERMDELEARFDKLEHHHKNLIRVGALAVTLSTGIDVLTIL